MSWYSLESWSSLAKKDAKEIAAQAVERDGHGAKAGARPPQR